MVNLVDHLNLLIGKGYKIEDHHFNWRKDALIQNTIVLINNEGHREFIQAKDNDAFELEKRVIQILHGK